VKVHTREWLRSFLNLGARAAQESIPLADIERQEDTVLRAAEMLEQRPGILLADEVGMGKTYEALGLAAIVRHARPRSRIVIITPGPTLNEKWANELHRFKAIFDFGDRVTSVHHLWEFIEAVRRKRSLVVAPVTMFQSGHGSGEQTYMLSLYFHWKGLHGHTANAIMNRFRDGEYDRVDVTKERFLGMFELEELEAHLTYAFCRPNEREPHRLDDLYQEKGFEAFTLENSTAVRNALSYARYVLTQRLIKPIDLLIVDEAHKLKNPWAMRSRAMHHAFDRRFVKAAFLTATPFQLDVDELREMFKLFARANDASKDLLDHIDALLASIRQYQDLYDDFEQTWSDLDPIVAGQFAKLYDNGSALSTGANDPSLSIVKTQIDKLIDLKKKSIEPGFRQWMIRSLRDDKRIYRQSERRDITARGATALPFLIYDRLIAELFRRKRQTFKPAVEINMVSSYSAADEGQIMANDGDNIPAEALPYWRVIKKTLAELMADVREHPKVQNVTTDALDAAERGEKTLIFCSRVATLALLRSELGELWERRMLEKWRLVYPTAAADSIFDSSDSDVGRRRGRHSLLQARFNRPQDVLFLALREPYLRTAAPIANWALQHLPDVIGAANERLQTVRVGKTAAERLDYQVAKRCVEQAAVELWIAAECGGDTRDQTIQTMRRADFLRLGMDLQEGEQKNDYFGDERPSWTISKRVARLVIEAGGSLCEKLNDALGHIDLKRRTRMVEQLARYLTYKQMPFIAELLGAAQINGVSVDPVESDALLAFVDRFWDTDAGKLWVERLRSFLMYFGQRTPEQQDDILNGPIKTGDFVRDTADQDARERLVEAFNTPLYPMVLVANEVMQEGMDLQKYCRRVIHHDLLWNPAQIEQRIGRVDRLGSLISRLRALDAAAKLEILYPVIRHTIDDRMYRTVKTREKWLEFLLGAHPNFSEYSFDDEVTPPLPFRLADALAIDLGPEHAR
jgi:superfamily II DNA or RNA helicase